MMKKLFTLCLACMLCLTLGGCQKANDSDKGKQEKITDATQLLIMRREALMSVMRKAYLLY